MLIAKGYVSDYPTNIRGVLYTLQNLFYAILFDPLIQVEVNRAGILLTTLYR